jgi:hypothetical protein
MRIFILVLMLVLPVSVFAQRAYTDVVYLKEGQVLKGKVRNIRDGRMQLYSTNGDTLSIEMSKIDRVRKEKAETSLDNALWEPLQRNNRVRYYSSVYYGQSAGLIYTSFGRFRDGAPAYGVATWASWSPFPELALGAGIGYEQNTGRQLMPIFADIRSDLLRRPSAPFLFMQAGYAPGWLEGRPGSNFGGGLLKTGLGWRTQLNQASALHLTLAYQQQGMQLRIIDLSGRVLASERVNYKHFTFGLAFSF